ncbi:MAG: hypothetical protein JO244_04690, partial [Solirubrobacterales bacterium]|nr:hypothetical protein [Solirubrobacterales bacterium]
MNVRTTIGVCATALSLLSLPVAAASAARFRLMYAGAGDWSTAYHSTPANPGGNPD